MKLQFLGATRQVTGSQYYVEAEGVRLLVDCGMFQERAFLGRNWNLSPVRPRDLNAVLLTHAHIDHCGLAPRLVQEGLRCPIITTKASVELVEVVLRDAAEIQAEDAAFKNKRHRKEERLKTALAEPLFTARDVSRTVPLLRGVAYGQTVKLGDRLSAVLHDAGHILGSAMIELRLAGNGQPQRLLFSGDIGQTDRPIIRDPSVFTEADYLVMESTYGNRTHESHGDVEAQLADVVQATIGRGGNVVIPIFAIERAQELIYHFGQLARAGRIPSVPVFLDSPMAAEVNGIFARHREDFDDEMHRMIAAGLSPLSCPGLRIVKSVEESKAINDRKSPCIILSTSGMCTGGRIKHHLAHNIGRPESTLLFVGYQSQGTLGRQILDGNREVRIHGRWWLVRAQAAQIQGFSGHADRDGLLKWLRHFQRPPKQLFLTHGEEEQSLQLAEYIRQTMGWNVTVPEYQQVVEL